MQPPWCFDEFFRCDSNLFDIISAKCLGFRKWLKLCKWLCRQRFVPSIETLKKLHSSCFISNDPTSLFILSVSYKPLLVKQNEVCEFSTVRAERVILGIKVRKGPFWLYIPEGIQDLTTNDIGQKLGTLGRYMRNWANIK